MAIKKREIEYAEEVDEVGLAVAELIRDIRAKKPIAAIAAENLTNVVKAVEGAEQVDDELEANRRVALQTMGYRTGDMVDALLKPAAPVA